MKLNNKILVSNVALSVVMFILTGMGMYYIVNSTIYDELDHHLLQHKTDIQQQLKENPESLDEIQRLGGLGSYEWVEIIPYNKSIAGNSNLFSTIDTVRYADVSNVPESYRMLKTTLNVGSAVYLLKIYEEVAAWDKISMTVLLSVLTGLFIWVILLYVVNQYVFGQVLAPFYDTIDRLKQISAPTQMVQQFPDTNTDEINVLNRALNIMLSQIKSSFEDQKKFIQNASHELRTPLSIIRQKTEKILAELNGEMDKKSVQRLNEIHKTTVRLTRLSNALLMISRVENKQYPLEDEIDFGIITGKVLNELRDFIEMKNLTIKQQVSVNITTFGNAELIHSAIYNIVQNAIKFSPEGGVITISLEDKDNDTQCYTVEDEGAGIPEDRMNEIFDRFKKGNSRVDEYENSTGLGLSIVQSICELHGFKCYAENRRPKGAKISIIL